MDGHSALLHRVRVENVERAAAGPGHSAAKGDPFNLAASRCIDVLRRDLDTLQRSVWHQRVCLPFNQSRCISLHQVWEQRVDHGRSMRRGSFVVLLLPMAIFNVLGLFFR